MLRLFPYQGQMTTAQGRSSMLIPPFTEGQIAPPPASINFISYLKDFHKAIATPLTTPTSYSGVAVYPEQITTSNLARVAEDKQTWGSGLVYNGNGWYRF